MPAGSVQRRPSIHSMVSMRPPLRSRRTQGIFTLGSPLKLRLKSCTAAAMGASRLPRCRLQVCLKAIAGLDFAARSLPSHYPGAQTILSCCEWCI